MNSALDIFDPITARWFARCVGAPTAVQEAAWPAIAVGDHTLVSAPTGTGKTLAAFLVFVDRLMAEARNGTLRQELRLIYVSPLKSLAGDIRENLRRPLDGISFEGRNTDAPVGRLPAGLTVAVRTGDTPQDERRRMIKTPPHILITTPESLYLMLSSKSGQNILKTARYIILDELHALIDTKRGAHLILSVARLDKICPAPLQRIGLSATIEPLSIAAEYLSPEHVTVAAPKMRKDIRLEITSPFSAENRIVQKDSVWQELAGAVYARCRNARSVIAFAEGRAYAEKLAYYVNRIGGEGFARTHHGSLSKQQRFEVEEALRSGTLRLLCATSSMELGIDVGEIDEVLQIGCPRSISSTMQRLGRAGHSPNRTSAMTIFQRSAYEALCSGLAAEVVRQGGIERARPPRLCLDVLAQHLVSMAAVGSYGIDEVTDVLKRAYPFREVTPEDVRGVLGMLAGDYEHRQDIPARPRLLYDRIHSRVEGDPYSRLLAVSAGGTIPDRGLFAVRTESGVKLGELDEEFVFEAHEGDKFLLGTFAWQIKEIRKDMVIVRQSSAGGARPPFWKGELRGRRLQTGFAYGDILRRLYEAHEDKRLTEALRAFGLDGKSAEMTEDLLTRQIAAAGALPDDRTLIVEHYCDETGNHQMMVHSVFGRPVNEPLAILLAEEAKRRLNTNVSFVADDDGLLLFPYVDHALPQGLLRDVSTESAGTVLSAVLPATPLFNMAFRYNAARALMMGVRKAGRQPLWVQRMRGAEMLDALVRLEDHPLIRETRRECLEDYWDLPGVVTILGGIRAGTIRVREICLELPSPMSMPLRHQTEAAMMYDYAPTTRGISAAVEDALSQAEMIAPTPEQLAMTQERTRLPEDENQLHSLLMIEGDITAGELDIPIDWLETLERREQVKYIEPGLWIAAEHLQDYHDALDAGDAAARADIVRRLLRYRGPQSVEQLAERYVWTDREALEILSALCRDGATVECDGFYYHAKLFERARRETVKANRRQIKTQPPAHYAAVLADRAAIVGSGAERLAAALEALSGLSCPPAVWESVLLPGRVGDYRPEFLDALLARGKFTWRLDSASGLSFHPYDDIDWDADMLGAGDNLPEKEMRIVDALVKAGASFAQRLGVLSGLDLFGDGSPYDALLSLAEKGLVSADSFMPVRQLLNQTKYENAPVKRRVKARVMTMTSGRWELVRPLKALPLEERLERLFDRFVLVCRETAPDLDWSAALGILRVWEYTGRVRRGYFIEGLSGTQFIRSSEFYGLMPAFEQPAGHIVWLPAVDPAQPWGKSLKHLGERSFQNVPGTAVALYKGSPAAVFERQGKTLRVFDDAVLPEALSVFTRDYTRHRLFPQLGRLTVQQYPTEAAAPLEGAGFVREMRDFVLYRDS